MQHWTINGRFLSQPVTGVQRYAWEIVRAIDRRLAAQPLLASAVSVDLVCPRSARLPAELEVIRVRRGGRLRGHLWEQMTLPWLVRGGLLSLGNVGPLAVRRQILCIHDLNARTFPQSYSFAFRAMQRLLVPLLARRCAKVATVSTYSAQDIVRHGLCGPGKVVVVPNGFEHVQRWTSDPGTASPAPATDRDTIVLVGTPAPHKNIAMILGLADRLKALGMKVAVVGSRDATVYRSVAAPASAAVIWLGALADALRNSFCLAFPSHVEGFGLPPLEAMALGCPVVASSATSIPEICGDAALYASPSDPEAWLSRFAELRGNPRLREALIARGLEQAKRFSWERSARLYLETMAELDRAALRIPSKGLRSVFGP